MVEGCPSGGLILGWAGRWAGPREHITTWELKGKAVIFMVPVWSDHRLIAPGLAIGSVFTCCLVKNIVKNIDSVALVLQYV